MRHFTTEAAHLLDLGPGDVGRPMVELSSRVDDPALLADARAVIETLAPVEREVCALDSAANGGDDRSSESAKAATCWYIRRILPYFAAEDELDGVVVTYSDVTGLQQTQEALRHRHQQMTTMLQSIRDAFVSFDRQWRYTFVNRAAEDMLAKSANELLGECIWDVFPGLHETKFYKEMHRSMREQKPTEVEEFYAPHNRWYNCRLFPSAAGLSLYFVDASVTHTLQESERRYRQLVNLLPTAMYTCDAEGRITFYNDQAEQRWGGAPKLNDDTQRFCGSQRLWTHEHVELPHDQSPMAIALRDGVTIRNQELTMELSGGRIDVVVNIDPLYDDQGDLIGAINVFNDVTQLKLAESEHVVHDVTTKERQRIGRDLHDSTSQELTGLGFMAQSLLEKLAELESSESPAAMEATLIARKMEEGVQRSLTQVRRFAQGLMPVELDAEGLMAALSDLAATTSNQHAVPCRFDCADKVGIDDNTTATQLFLIAKEAVANATKHARAENIRIELSRTEGDVRLVIRDDGVGMPQVTAEDGMGLGIMRHRASLIQAKLEIESERGTGTLVRCVLVGERRV
jgi:PAS domain S-box-containing protein